MKIPQVNNDEINIIELIQTVWRGKWKIAIVVVILFIAVISYQSTKTKNFTAITEIKPLSLSELNKYFVLNNKIKFTDTDGNFEFQKITQENLLQLYIDILRDKSVFEDAMRKLNFLDASQYSDEQGYNEEIIKLASSVKILTPLIDKKKNKGNLEMNYHSINFVHYDVKKWKNVLIYADELANQIVKKNLLENYDNNLSLLKKKKEYNLENLKTLMTNTQIDFDKKMKRFEMNLEFQLEDSQTKINNALVDYDRKISDRLTFLREQAAIARRLDIAKNTIATQMFKTQSGMVTNIKTDASFYLRGYEAIEKEIELIEMRDNKQAFVSELLELEQEKRSLEQDRTLLRAKKNKVFIDTLIELEKKQRAIEQDKIIEQIELAFQSTPLANNNKFSVTLTNVLSTKFEYQNNKILVIAIVIIGLIVGVFYVIISDAFQTHSVSRKKLIKPTF